MKPARIFVAVVVGIVVFGGVIGVTKFRDYMIQKFFANMPKAVVTVTIDQARDVEWPSTVPAVGTLRAINGVDVSAQISGQVISIAFDSGQVVREGDLLVQLNIEEEQSELASARATEKLANITADRARSLVRTSAGTKANLDDAVAQLEIAAANRGQIEARIAKKTIRAPFNGVLGVRQVNVGEYVAPGQVLVNLQDLRSIHADFTVSQRQLSIIKDGAFLRMNVDTWPGRTFQGEITAIAPLVDVRTGMINVEGLFDNSDVALRPGMLVRVEATRPEKRMELVIPVEAVTYQLSGDTVFVVHPLPQEDQDKLAQARADAEKEGADALAAFEKRRHPQYTVQRRSVTVGDRQGDRVVVLSGLSAGDTIVTSGQMKLENGSYITVSDTKLAPVDVNARPQTPSPASKQD